LESNSESMSCPETWLFTSLRNYHSQSHPTSAEAVL